MDVKLRRRAVLEQIGHYSDGGDHRRKAPISFRRSGILLSPLPALPAIVLQLDILPTTELVWRCRDQLSDVLHGLTRCRLQLQQLRDLQANFRRGQPAARGNDALPGRSLC